MIFHECIPIIMVIINMILEICKKIYTDPGIFSVSGSFQKNIHCNVKPFLS